MVNNARTYIVHTAPSASSPTPAFFQFVLGFFLLLTRVLILRLGNHHLHKRGPAGPVRSRVVFLEWQWQAAAGRAERALRRQGQEPEQPGHRSQGATRPTAG